MTANTTIDKFEDNAADIKIGFVDENGWRYAGISETTGTKLWVANKDSKIMTWNNAVKFTQELKDFQGYNGSVTNNELPLAGTSKTIEEVLQSKNDGGVRLPTKAELNQLYENKADLGNNFDSSDQWYWSSSEYYGNVAYIQDLSDGKQDFYGKSSCSSVRCVRSEPRPKP